MLTFFTMGRAMAYYSQYNEQFREKANTLGFSYSLRHTLTVIPTAFAHLGDTILHLDGTLGKKDKNDYAHGPLGAILTFPLMFIGTVIGTALQWLFNIPSYVGHYLLDRPLGISKVMVDTPLELLSMLTYNLTTGLPLPLHMRGFFGFILGVVPEIVRYSVNRLLATITSTLKYLVDHLCDGIRAIYSFMGSKLFSPSLEPQPDLKEPLRKDATFSDDAPQPERKKKRRIHRAADLGPEMNEILCLDLFSCLGITKAAFEEDASIVNKAYRKMAIQKHPDKIQERATAANQPFDKEVCDREWAHLEKAKVILNDPNKAKLYIANANFGKAPNFFAPQPARQSMPHNDHNDHNDQAANQATSGKRRVYRPGE